MIAWKRTRLAGLRNVWSYALLGIFTTFSFDSVSSDNPGTSQGPVSLSSREGKRLVARAEEQGKHVYSLDELLALAETNYPKVREARARFAFKKAQLWEARTAPFSEFKVEGGVGVAPTLSGTSVYSPSTDVALTKNLALAYQLGVEGVVPLWTFGKITNLWEAAEANRELGRHEIEKEKNSIRMDVRRAYYGVLLARDSKLLLQQASKNLDEFVSKLQQKVDDGEGDEIELLEIKIQRAELTARGTDADKGETAALAGLRFYAGAVGPVDVPDVPLERIDHPLGPVSRYLEAARLHRPEINMARAGVAARRAQIELAKAKFYPDLGIGIQAGIIRAGEVTDQRNPFTRDPGNRATYGMGFVLRWKLDFLPQSARLAQARAQLEEVRATERFALGGIAAEVEVSYAEAAAAKTKLDAWSEATSYAKRWLIKVQQGLDLGISDQADLVEPSKTYALKKASEMEALYDFNIALAKLAQATGWEGMLR